MRRRRRAWRWKRRRDLGQELDLVDRRDGHHHRFYGFRLSGRVLSFV